LQGPCFPEVLALDQSRRQVPQEHILALHADDAYGDYSKTRGDKNALGSHEEAPQQAARTIRFQWSIGRPDHARGNCEMRGDGQQTYAPKNGERF
jgi:hypothetical protein